MPRIYRAMTRDGDKPMIGASRDALGVVPGEPPSGDIAVDEHDQVAPGTGGMSVTRSWRDLPPGRIPKRLRHLAPDARGSNRYVCWQMGDGAFENAVLTGDLALRVDSATHGLVEPLRQMGINEFQHQLTATRDEWNVIDEDSQP